MKAMPLISWLCLLLCSFLRVSAFRSPSVALCITTKDDNLDILEWAEYHKRIGVNNIYVIDDKSSSPMATELLDLINEGFIVYEYFDKAKLEHQSHNRNPLLLYYEQCLARYGFAHDWLGFVDSDEYVVLGGSTKSIGQALTPFMHGSLCGVVMSWRTYADSGHEKRPPGGVLKNYNKCCMEGSRGHEVKSFVRPMYALYPRNPHTFVCRRHSQMVNALMMTYRGAAAMDPGVYQHLWLNHYVTKSLEEFQHKIAKGGSDLNHRNMWYFQLMHDDCNSTCPVLRMPPKRKDYQD